MHHLTCNSSDHVPIYISLLGLDPPIQKKVFVSNKCGSQIMVVRKWSIQPRIILMELGLMEKYWLRLISGGKI